jgi:hypothetical protein
VKSNWRYTFGWLRDYVRDLLEGGRTDDIDLLLEGEERRSLLRAQAVRQATASSTQMKESE